MKLVKKTVTGNQLLACLLQGPDNKGVMGRALEQPLAAQYSVPLARLTKALAGELDTLQERRNAIIKESMVENKIPDDKLPAVNKAITDMFATPFEVQVPEVVIPCPQFVISGGDVMALDGLVDVGDPVERVRTNEVKAARDAEAADSPPKE